MKQIFLVVFIVAVFALDLKVGLAATPSINEYQSLTFGEMKVSGTTAQQIVIGPDGSENHDLGITLLLPGHIAILRLMDFPPSTILSILADDSTLSRQPSGPAFDIISFTFDPDASNSVTDSDGKLILRIGATLRTRAGVTYTPGPYRGIYNLMVNY